MFTKSIERACFSSSIKSTKGSRLEKLKCSDYSRQVKKNVLVFKESIDLPLQLEKT